MIELKNVTKKFGALKAVDEVSLTVKKGERLAVIGPSGSGKSTLIRCVNLLENYESGDILFLNENIKQLDENVYRKKVGMVFQHFNLFKNLTILQNVVLAPVNAALDREKQYKKLQAKLTKVQKSEAQHLSDFKIQKFKDAAQAFAKNIGVTADGFVYSPLSKKDIVQKAESEAKELLKRIGLSEKADAYPSSLSGGQKQRIAIIRALAMKPEILLFDEPTSALDIEMVKEVLSLIKELADEGMTMIIVTHELKFAKRVATKIVFMDNGKIVETGTPEKMFGAPETERLQEFLKKVEE